MMQVSLVPPDHVLRVWDSILPYMEKAAEYTYGRYTAEDIYTSVTERDYLLWIAFDGEHIAGAVVTGFVDYPRKRYLVTHFCAGVDGATWKAPMLTTLQRWARDNHCVGIESSGRLGWSKIFKAEGYTPLWQTYELPAAPAGQGD